MPLEPTNQQAVDLTVELATRYGGMGQTRAMDIALFLWPLVRDIVLEHALHCMEELQTWDEVAVTGGEVISVCDYYLARSKLLALKGAKP